MSSNHFLDKVQDIAVKTRLISRKQDLEELLDDAWLYEEEEEAARNKQDYDVNYYDNTLGRSYDNPKRETGRSAKSDKRTFGYQLPLRESDGDEFTEREVKRSSRPLTYRRSKSVKTKLANSLNFDVVK